MSDTDDFLALSKLLTGEDELDPTLAEAYRRRLERFYGDDLKALLGAFHEVAGGPDAGTELTKVLDQSGRTAIVAKELITIWFTSQFTRPDRSQDGPEDAGQYRSSLLWKVIRAHVPAVSDGPYGYWEHHPDAAGAAG